MQRRGKIFTSLFQGKPHSNASLLLRDWERRGKGEGVRMEARVDEGRSENMFRLLLDRGLAMNELGFKMCLFWRLGRSGFWGGRKAVSCRGMNIGCGFLDTVA